MILLSNIKKLYDGTAADRSALREGVDLYLKDGKVADLRPHDPKSSGQNGLTRIDCRDYTVTPGLFDCHGHLTILGTRSAELDRMNSPVGYFLIEKILHTSLVDGGVTTMRDIGGATHFIKRMVEEGVLIGPRLKIAICMLSSTGGHADFRGPDRCHAELSRLFPEAPGRPSSMVDGPWECRKRVREIVASGADLIKICASPGVASPSDKLESREFTAEEIAAICDEASGRGLKVAAHAHSKNGIELAIRNGVSDLQHISFMDERLVELAHQKGCSVTPTSWVIEELTRSEGLAPAVREKVKKVVAVHQSAVQYAHRGGLPILSGTDPVFEGMHGRNYMELASLIRDGLSPLAAWHGATGLAAKTIGQEDAGELRVGQRADLLIGHGDFLEKPQMLGEGALIEVVKDGVGYRGGVAGIPQRTFRSSIAEALSTKTERRL